MPDPAGGVGVFAAFAAGLVSFLSPCVLPLVPGYLSADQRRRAWPSSSDADWRRVVVPSLAVHRLVLGHLHPARPDRDRHRRALREHRDLLTDIAGVLIIVMGVLFVASFFVARLNREWRVDALMERAGSGGPVVAGAAFAIAWTPVHRPDPGPRS